MDYETFASDLPRQGIFTFTCAEENEETMQRFGVHQQMRQLGRGTFQSDMAVREFEHATLFADRFSKACSINLGPPAGSVGIAIFRSAGAEFFADGTNVANDKMVVYPDGSQTDLLTRDFFGSDAMTFPQLRFNEMFESLCPTCVRPESATIIGGNTTQLRRLRDAIVRRLAQPDSEVNEEDISDLVAATIAWIGDPSGSWQPENVPQTVAHARIAKQAQEYIEEQYSDQLHIEDLCRVTGIGVRTLQRSFRKQFNLSVREYVKTVRLQAAHRELLAADPSQGTVAEIALRNGFAHLGRFSVEFHERFGKTARMTLGMRAHPGIYFRRGPESPVERTHGQLQLLSQPAEATA
jgi:AraC-like DNA-binding protein